MWSWKKELLRGLVEVKGEVARQQGIILTQMGMIEKQQRVIDRLLDRIQAKDFKELKTFTVSEETELVRNEFYSPLSDEELAGTVAAIEEGREGEIVEG